MAAVVRFAGTATSERTGLWVVMWVVIVVFLCFSGSRIRRIADDPKVVGPDVPAHRDNGAD